MPLNLIFRLFLVFTLITHCARPEEAKEEKPNILIIFSDDQRFDAAGFAGNPIIRTPTLDKLASEGVIFENSFVALSICSPSRAALLTGRYGSANGVTTFGKVSLNPGERTVARDLRDIGYATGITGKWHLKDSPSDLGFDYASYFFSNGSYYNRPVIEQGEEKEMDGFIEDYNADQAIRFLEGNEGNDAPFLLFYCPQLPHLDNRFEWDVTDETLALYADAEISPPDSWQDDLRGKPAYLKEGRHRQQALSYHYDNRDTLTDQIKRYYAAITEMDASLGRVIDYLEGKGEMENTWIFFMGDNGWFIGDHGFTSKVLAYEPSIRVPFFVSGPGIDAGTLDEKVMNIDIMPTILDIAGVTIPGKVHGSSLLPLLKGENYQAREHIYYEAPQAQLGSWPLHAYRDDRWKYIQTFHPEHPDSIVFEELYDLANDFGEMDNLISETEHEEMVDGFREQLLADRDKYKR